VSELHRRHPQQVSWSISPAVNSALHIVGSAPAGTTAADASADASTAAAAASKDSQAMQQSPSTGGLASWLGANSRASFALKAAGSSRRKSTAGKGLRLLQQRGVQRGSALAMPAAPTELPCELCVPQLPSEVFGELHCAALAQLRVAA
jgi:hypothetical protein